jgi:hypothetical protein
MGVSFSFVDSDGAVKVPIRTNPDSQARALTPDLSVCFQSFMDSSGSICEAAEYG